MTETLTLVICKEKKKKGHSGECEASPQHPRQFPFAKGESRARRAHRLQSRRSLARSAAGRLSDSAHGNLEGWRNGGRVEGRGGGGGSGNDQQPPPDCIPGNPIHLHSSISLLSEMMWWGGPHSDCLRACVCVCALAR